jgi:hypothetical protein
MLLPKLVRFQMHSGQPIGWQSSHPDLKLHCPAILDESHWGSHFFDESYAFKCLPGQYFSATVINPTWKWPISIILRYMYTSNELSRKPTQRPSNGLTYSNNPGCMRFQLLVCPLILVVAYCFIFEWCFLWIPHLHPTDFMETWIAYRFKNALSESFTSDYNPLLSHALNLWAFQWVSRILLWVVVAFSISLVLCYYWSDSRISEMGDVCHLDNTWFGAIWSNLFWDRRWYIQQMKKRDVFVDNGSEHSCDCVVNCFVWFWFNLGISILSLGSSNKWKSLKDV